MKKEKYTTSKWSLKKPLYLKKTDKRYKNHVKQLKERGFSSAETWALDSVICEFVLPRLKRFREITISYPPNLTPEKWNDIIDKMIFAFDWSLMCEEDDYYNLDEETKKANWEKYTEGMKLFAEYFRDLWW